MIKEFIILYMELLHKRKEASSHIILDEDTSVYVDSMVLVKELMGIQDYGKGNYCSFSLKGTTYRVCNQEDELTRSIMEKMQEELGYE